MHAAVLVLDVLSEFQIVLLSFNGAEGSVRHNALKAHPEVVPGDGSRDGDQSDVVRAAEGCPQHYHTQP